MNRFVQAILAIQLLAETPATAADLPKGFVYLKDIDASIRQDVRYAGKENFMRRPVNGYAAPVCILSKKAADALATVQRALAAVNETLVVFDCYRPDRATKDMVAWSKESDEADARYFPNVRRNRLVPTYVARISGHSRGSTVDLAIAPLDPSMAAPDPACGVREAKILDFGSGLDCLDPLSQTASKDIGETAIANRRRLSDMMAQAGFMNYSLEWWHFSLNNPPFRTAFDFEVAE